MTQTESAGSKQQGKCGLEDFPDIRSEIKAQGRSASSYFALSGSGGSFLLCQAFRLSANHGLHEDLISRVHPHLVRPSPGVTTHNHSFASDWPLPWPRMTKLSVPFTPGPACVVQTNLAERVTDVRGYRTTSCLACPLHTASRLTQSLNCVRIP